MKKVFKNVFIASLAILISCLKADLIDPPTLTGKALNEYSVELTRGDVDDLKITDSFIIYVSESADGTFVKRASFISSETKFIIGDLNTLTDYWFKIAVKNSAGVGPMSAAVKVTTTDMTVPISPTGFTVTKPNVSNPAEKCFNWENVPNADYYHIYRSITLAGTYSKININNNDKFIVSANINTTANYFKISAVNAKGESPLSESVMAQWDNFSKAINAVTTSQDTTNTLLNTNFLYDLR